MGWLGLNYFKVDIQPHNVFKYADTDTHCFPNFLWCFLRADINHPLLPAEMTARDLRPFSLRVGVMGVDGALLLGADRFLQWGQHVLQLSLLGHDEIQLMLQPARMGPRLEGHWAQGNSQYAYNVHLHHLIQYAF